MLVFYFFLNLFNFIIRSCKDEGIIIMLSLFAIARCIACLIHQYA